MTEENKNGEASSANELFEDLIEDFKLDQAKELTEAIRHDDDEKPRTMRDFSKFFEDATASGSGFESTIDSVPKEEIDVTTAPEMLDFTEPKDKSIITEPVTDKDGMIVIYDEEAGIDATGYSIKADDNDSIDCNIVDDSITDDNPEIATDDIVNNYDTDGNMEAVESDENDGNEKTNSEKIEEAELKPPFVSRLIPWKGDGIAEIVRKIVFLAAVGVFAVAAILLVSTLVQSQEMQEQVSQIEEKVTTTAATSIDESGVVVTIPPTTEEREKHNESIMVDFIEISSNVKGFIEIPGCDIYLPVVQGTDNDYYLTHTYDDRKNKAGSIFIDYRCTVTEDYTSPNIVLYGHNQEDGTMFGNLKFYKNNVDFYKSNPSITFNTEFGIGDYVIFGYFIANVHEYQDANGEVFHYHDYIETLGNENTFNWYMEMVGERNQIISPVDVKFGDKLLVLSTCSNEYSDSRFVVMARKLREDEQLSDFDFSSTRLNPEAKQIDWSVIMSGETSQTEETTTPETTSQTTTKKKKKKTTTAASEETTVTTEETTTEEAASEETTISSYTGTIPKYTGTPPTTTTSLVTTTQTVETTAATSEVTTLQTTGATSQDTAATTTAAPQTSSAVTSADAAPEPSSAMSEAQTVLS